MPAVVGATEQSMRWRVGLMAAVVALAALGAGCSKPDRPTVNLYLTMERGDLDQLKRHIAWGTDVLSPLPDGRTPLQIAAADGREVFVELLLKAGADPEARGADGHTALETALINGRIQVATLLAPRKKPIDANGLLLVLARNGTRDRYALAFVLQRGADLNARGPDGDSALLIAVRRNDRVFVRHLLDRGADPYVTDANGKSALAVAEELGHEDVARLLRRQGAGMGG
jgi:ankyrin repeat protein